MVPPPLGTVPGDATPPEPEPTVSDIVADDHINDDGDWETCDHDCVEAGCGDYCFHQHCPWCGGCNCPGYCDDYQTYNLRPEETGGTATT